MDKNIFFIFGLCLLLFFSSFFNHKDACAEVEIEELHNVVDSFSIGMRLSTFYRFDEDPYFGADITKEEGASTDFGETWAEFSLTAKKALPWTDIEVQLAPYYVETFGQDFYGGFKDTSDFEIDQAWINFGKLFNTSFDFKVGRQDIQIEKWFIMGDGEGQPAATWLSWHESFPYGVRLDGEIGPLKSTAFWARTGDYWQNWDNNETDVQVAGINLHYDISDKAYLYGGVYGKIDDGGEKNYGGVSYTPNGNKLVADYDTYAWDIGVDYNVGNFHLEGELVYQTGDAGHLDGEERDRDALGYFAKGSYSIPVKFSPYISAQYLYFSGDEDYQDDEGEDYDPMFHGFSTWNRWIIGELVGEAHLPNSNKKVSILEIGFAPIERVNIALMYLDHKLDEDYYLYPINQVSDNDWADEINLFVDFMVTENLYAHFGFGYVSPNDAAEEIFGDSDAYFSQVLLDFSM